MRTIFAFIFLILLVVVAPVSALDIKWEVHPNWRMLVCAGYGYSLELDNETSTFRLIYLSECDTVFHSVCRGKFVAKKDTIVLDFGELKAYYYLKSPHALECYNTSDSLSEEEQAFICDPTNFSDVNDPLTPDSKDKIFVKNPTLFLSKIEKSGDSEVLKWLVQDLSAHCFIAERE